MHKNTKEVIEVIGFFGAIVIGVVLGLIGGGGSILTVPIFVYLFDVDPVQATAYSLFVVGTTSLVGTIKNLRMNLIDVKTGIIFSVPAFITVYLTRAFLLPIIPDELVTITDFVLTKNIGIMLFFAIIMLIAAYFMIVGNTVHNNNKDQNINIPLVIVEGVVVGLLTGIVGAGGGFLIIPALVLLANLDMKTAVATSLMIIALKSLLGFIGDIQNLYIDWLFLFSFTILSIIGIFIGIYLTQFIEGKKLKKGFGWFVLIMGIYIVLKELL